MSALKFIQRLIFLLSFFFSLSVFSSSFFWGGSCLSIGGLHIYCKRCERYQTSRLEASSQGNKLWINFEFVFKMVGWIFGKNMLQMGWLTCLPCREASASKKWKLLYLCFLLDLFLFPRWSKSSRQDACCLFIALLIACPPHVNTTNTLNIIGFGSNINRFGANNK